MKCHLGNPSFVLDLSILGVYTGGLSCLGDGIRCGYGTLLPNPRTQMDTTELNLVSKVAIPAIPDFRAIPTGWIDLVTIALLAFMQSCKLEVYLEFR